MMPPPLVLASTSPYRRALLERLGLPFLAEPPGVDEERLKDDAADLGPRELAGFLAAAKATSLGRPGIVVVGGDQLIAFEGEILGKPGSVPAAIEQLARLSGRTHELVTAIAVWHEGRIVAHTDIARMTVRDLSRDEITRYVEADMPLDCAGSYKLESLGIALFDRIQTDDHSAIIGMPLIALTTILRGMGYRIP